MATADGLGTRSAALRAGLCHQEGGNCRQASIRRWPRMCHPGDGAPTDGGPAGRGGGWAAYTGWKPVLPGRENGRRAKELRQQGWQKESFCHTTEATNT